MAYKRRRRGRPRNLLRSKFPAIRFGKIRLRNVMKRRVRRF